MGEITERVPEMLTGRVRACDSLIHHLVRSGEAGGVKTDLEFLAWLILSSLMGVGHC